MTILFLILALNSNGPSAPVNFLANNFSYNKEFQQYSYKIIPTVANTYGYEIYSGKKLFIKQLSIPGIPGNNGFSKKSDAEKVAKLVTFKLSKGLMPPTVEKKEMDSLQVKY